MQFAAAANPDPITRTGGITVNGRRAALTQAAADCAFSLAEMSASYPQAGGAGSVAVRASSALCDWTATSDADWLAITSGGSGKGSAPVGFTVAATTGPPRTATLRIAGLAFVVTQSEGCAFAIAPTTFAAGSAGGTGTVAVSAGVGCPWTASSNVGWISISTISGSGSGTVGFTVAGTSGPSRTGTVTIAGQVFTVTQSPGCGFDVSPLTHTADASGGARTVSVSAASGCGWTSSSNAPWITITSGGSGSGSGTVGFSVAPTTGSSRTGTLVVAGQTVTVVQGQGCTFAISPDTQNVAAAGGSGSVAVSAGSGCAWTASSNQPWLTITAGNSGNGAGTVTFTVASTTGPSRSGTLTIAGRTFTVNQGQGCAFSLSATSGPVPAGGGAGSFDVRTTDGCAWSASSDAGWLTLTAGAAGTGNGNVRYSAAANTGPQRTARIVAGGQTFTVTQAAGCTYSLAPTSHTAAAGGGTTSVAVTAPGGCTWTGASSANWIGISPGSGSGDGTVQLVVAANSEGARQGTVTIAGRTFTVSQDSGCTTAVAPAGAAFPAAGGPGSFNVTTGATCAWTASPSAGWISVTSGGTGSGGGTVQFTVAANPGPSRDGAITVSGQTFTITQAEGCTATVAPDTIAAPSAGSTPSVTVTTGDACAWTAVANAAWVRVQGAASGSGNGAVQFSIDVNAGPARSGTATVAGRTVTINQDSGCTFSIAPTTTPMAVGGGTGSVSVTTSDGCAWTAASNVAWVTVTGGGGGSGNGTVQFIVDANATGAARTGTITVAGQVFTVEQAGA